VSVESEQPRYTQAADGTHIAYRVMGDGPIDVVYAFGYESNIDADGDVPFHAAFRRRLASFARLILFDRRGTGLSDRGGLEDAGAIEAGMDDIRAVMDAVGSERALLFAVADGGIVSVLFAASHPDRTLGLVLYNPEPRQTRSADYPWAWTDEQWDERIRHIEANWGSLAFAEGDLHHVAPDVAFDSPTVDRVARMFRAVASPASAAAIAQSRRAADVRSVLPLVQVPTLVLHSSDDDSAKAAAYTASTIPGAEEIEIATNEWLPFWGSAEAVIEETRRFVQRIRHEEAVLDRVLATILFTDIVGSTSKAVELGDRAWKDLLERHNQVIRAMLRRYRGSEVDTAGDGFFALFDGPARGVRCALAMSRAVKALGLEIRAGLHAGEVETVDSKAGGIAVNIGARVGGLAGAGEVLVSRTVRDLVVGSDLAFEDAGDHELKGVPDHWRLYRVVNQASEDGA
jgi:class 3 adenylate cyclase/pimeloyl-ACP methyl ester carboxylesterase